MHSSWEKKKKKKKSWPVFCSRSNYLFLELGPFKKNRMKSYQQFISKKYLSWGLKTWSSDRGWWVDCLINLKKIKSEWNLFNKISKQVFELGPWNMVSWYRMMSKLIDWILKKKKNNNNNKKKKKKKKKHCNFPELYPFENLDFLCPATKSGEGIMLYPTKFWVSVHLSIPPSLHRNEYLNGNISRTVSMYLNRIYSVDTWNLVLCG